MDIQVALDPVLGVSPQEFTRAWNETPECRQSAQAGLVNLGRDSYDPTLITIVLTIAADLMVGVAGAALYDLIKLALARRGVHQPTQVEQHELPDGSKVLVVRLPEDEL
jgi:hypothetical protein